jgi:CheY-like chemotaxis protein
VLVRAEYVQHGLPHAQIQNAPPELLTNDGGGSVRITVVDDGAGLSDEQLNDICKEGVQFNVNTLQAGGGSGLGLFISKGIVEQQGGTMTVTSEGLGKGATFVIELPLFRLDRSEALQTTWVPAKPRAEGADASHPFPFAAEGPTKYLLVVDDALSNRKMLMRILKAKGYVCREAANGQLALDVYQQMCADDCAPSVVLMDYEMPVMNGPTAARHLREMGCRSLIVGVSGNVMQADVDFFIDQGADQVLGKPLNIGTLDSMVSRHTVHSTQYTESYSTQHTVHSTQHTAHSTQHTSHSLVFVVNTFVRISLSF